MGRSLAGGSLVGGRVGRGVFVMALVATPMDVGAQLPLLTRVSTRAQAYLDSLHAVMRFPGAVVGVVLPDGRSLSVATGWADTAMKERMTTAHRMPQGSVGTTYVSAVTLQLAQENRLRLDDPIAKYLGREPWFGRLPNAYDITVRELMNHTSGIGPYEFTAAFTRDLTSAPDRIWKPDQLVSYILDAQAPFAAGQGWEYSDTNYILLGMIIERITGRRYYDLLLDRIVSRLDLTNTIPTDHRGLVGLANGYAGPRNPFGGRDAMLDHGDMVINPQFEWTGGGLASTAEDLARWGKALYEGEVFDSTTLAQMLESVPAKLGPNTRYGLGVTIRESSLGPVYGHSGFFPGYLTELVYVPSARVAVALQVNSSAPGALLRPPFTVALEFAQLVVEEVRR